MSEELAEDSLTVRATTSVSDEGSSYVLQVVEGPQTGASLAIDGGFPGRALVGSSHVCQLVLADPEVSRRHAALELTGGRLRISDLGSTNGTYVDGVCVTDALLRGGELVRVGSSGMRVESARSGSVEISAATRFGKTVGFSEAMRRIYPLCARLAASNVTVVIEGETGTGKEVLAESLHEEGPRKDGPFVVFDCTAVAPSLVESELFGHEKGSFSGAVAAHQGFFEQADGGTLLIDEIGDLDQSLQAKLLRVLQRGEVRRVGGTRSIPVDVRVLAATRRDLDAEVQAGRFRDDLYFRLVIARVELPPLRSREGDIAVLAGHFWSKLGGAAGGVPYELLRRLEAYSWPGNVRELHNAVARFIALGSLVDFGSRSRSTSERPPPAGDLVDEVLSLDLPFASARQRVLDEFERRYVARTLEKHGGNVGRAAEAAGIARRYFQLLKARAK